MAPEAHKVLYSPIEHQKEDLSPKETLLATHRSNQENSTGYVAFARPQIIPVFPRHQRFHQANQVKAMSVDLEKAIALDSIPTFEATATIPGDEGIFVYHPERFVLNHEHQASALSLDARVAMLFLVVAAAPNPDGSAVDLDLRMVLVAALSQPGSQEEKRQKARQALLRAVCEHLLPRTAADGTPFGGLRCLHDLIVFPRPGASPPNTPLPEPSVQPGQEPPSNEASSRKRTLGDRAEDNLESLLGSLPTRSETSSMSESSPSPGSFRIMATPTK